MCAPLFLAPKLIVLCSCLGCQTSIVFSPQGLACKSHKDKEFLGGGGGFWTRLVSLPTTSWPDIRLLPQAPSNASPQSSTLLGHPKPQIDTIRYENNRSSERPIRSCCRRLMISSGQLWSCLSIRLKRIISLLVSGWRLCLMRGKVPPPGVFFFISRS